MYSSPMVVLAGSSLLSVLPTATRIVPCASAGPARPAASSRGNQHSTHAISLLKTCFEP